MTTITAPQMTFDRKKITVFLLDHIIEVFLVILIIGLALGTKNFMTWANWMNIFRANSLKGVIAFGMTMVIIAGLIDLSIGSTVGLAGVIIAVACRDLTGLGLSLNVACLIGIAICLAQAFATGWMHGFFQHRTGMPPFIVTLVSLGALYGLAGMISGGFPDCESIPRLAQPVRRRPGWGSERHSLARSYPGRFFPDRLVHHGVYHHRAVDVCHRRQPEIGPSERHQCGQNQNICFYFRTSLGSDLRDHDLRAGDVGHLQLRKRLGAGCDQHGDHRRHQFQWRCRYGLGNIAGRYIYWRDRATA